MENSFEFQKQENYAGFWLRFAAYLIDNIIVSMMAGIIMIPASVITGISMFALFNDDYSDEQKIVAAAGVFSALLVFAAIVIIIQWLYFALQESSAAQATIGKRAMGIMVTDMSGNRISFLNATGRHFGKIVSGLIANIGYIMAAFTQRKQALHDIMANCLVVKKPLQLY